MGAELQLRTVPMPVRALVLVAALATLAACGQRNALTDPPRNLGDFALGINVAVADKVQKVPISRDATPEAWEAAMEKAVADRLGRHQGSKLYNIGVVVEAYALAPPGIPIVAAPKSILVVSAVIFDDASQTLLNPDGKGRQFTVFERGSKETFIGSGLTQTAEQQMANLSAQAALAIEDWLYDNRDWFGVKVRRSRAAPPPTVVSAAPLPAVPAPAALPPPAAAGTVAGGAAPPLPLPPPAN
jgi:hypothetical protein